MSKLLATFTGAALAAASVFSGSASATVYFTENFNGYTGATVSGTQAGTGLTVYANGSLPGWYKNTGPGNLHAVQRSSGDFAAMFYDGSMMYYASPIAANALNASYTVSFDGAFGVFEDSRQITSPTDYIQFYIRDANGTIGSFSYTPTSTAFMPTSFTYTGTGVAGGIYVQIYNGVQGDNRFGGAIDNLSVQDTVLTAVAEVPEPASIALLAFGAAGVLGLRRRAKTV